MKKYILLPNLGNVKNKILWIKGIKEITDITLTVAKNDFCDKIFICNHGTVSEPKWDTQEYPLNKKEFLELGLDKEHILAEMIRKGFIRKEGGTIRDLIDEALLEGKYKHAIELIRILEKLGDM